MTSKAPGSPESDLAARRRDAIKMLRIIPEISYGQGVLEAIHEKPEFSFLSRGEYIEKLENFQFIHPAIVSNLQRSKHIAIWNPIQCASFPLVSTGHTFIHCYTGSGKTYAYAAPLLTAALKGPRLLHSDGMCTPEVVVLVATNELALQTIAELRMMLSGTGLDVGNMSNTQNIDALEIECRKGFSVAVGTSGTFWRFTHTQYQERDARTLISLERLKYLVLDEVDQTLTHLGGEFFSLNFAQLRLVTVCATMSREVIEFHAEALKENLKYMSTVETVCLPPDLHLKLYKHPSHTTLEGYVDFITTNIIRKKLDEILKGDWQCLIFCNKVVDSERVYQGLRARCLQLGVKVAVVNSAMDLEERRRFVEVTMKTVHVIVSTDLYSRGIDSERIECIVSLQLPVNGNSLLQRVGRTARSGKTGVALAFYTDAQLEALDYERYVQFHKKLRASWLGKGNDEFDNALMKKLEAFCCLHGKPIPNWSPDSRQQQFEKIMKERALIAAVTGADIESLPLSNEVESIIDNSNGAGPRDILTEYTTDQECDMRQHSNEEDTGANWTPENRVADPHQQPEYDDNETRGSNIIAQTHPATPPRCDVVKNARFKMPDVVSFTTRKTNRMEFITVLTTFDLSSVVDSFRESRRHCSQGV